MPLHDRPHVPADTVVALILWAAAVTALFACGWLFLAHHRDAAIFMGFASGVLAPAAGVVTLRGWLAEVGDGVRNAGNMARAANRVHRLND